ncbi:transketolase family protein [Streptomyces sp. NBC_01089]|uniref:transketolase family protein n=1 Tax=Streptomyces sp. NBC_01089 TaxID=2903747 RepID=UPI00386D3B17|nr:transketolase family protein [Streptomyces sp. NBC_01089]
MREAPYPTVLKPYGRALVELARNRPDVVCLSGDLTRQCEVDLFQEAFPDRFIHAGMAEANMMSMAGALAREGLIPFVHTFGVFATRRPYDQVVNAIAYPNLPVRIIGFMPGLSTPGGPSHQAIEDVAIMRALPNMTVVDVADAVEIAQVIPAIVDHPGPVYLRLKRGEIPVVFDEEHQFSLTAAQHVVPGGDVVLVTSGMMLPATLRAADVLAAAGVAAGVVNVPVIKPLDRAGILRSVGSARAVVTVENHTVIGGLGSAVAEALAESGAGVPLRRVGIQDTFAEGSKSGPYLFEKYGLSTQHIVDTAWSLLGRRSAGPRAPEYRAEQGEYAPV